MTKARAMASIGAATALLFVGGCGKAADKLAEKAAEKAVENAAGGGNFDIDGDGFTFESEDGTVSYSMDENGNVVMKGPDGEVITADSDGNVTMEGTDGETTYATGENAELPSGWPRFLTPPSGSTLVTSTTSTEGDQKVGSITAEVDGDVRDVYQSFKDALEDEGFDIGSDSYTEASGSDFASISAEKGDMAVNVSVGTGSGDRPFLSISVSGL